MSISISGNGTFTGATADYSFDQSVGIAGTLTYEDVTSIDSVGVITARSGIKVGPTSGIGITMNANGSATFAGALDVNARADIGTNSLNDYAVAGFTNSATYGGIYAQNNNASGNLFTGNENTTEVFKVRADGSATFAGAVESTSFFKVTNTGIAYLQPNTVTAFQAYESSGPVKINLNNNGTADFTGRVLSNAWFQSERTDGTNSAFYATVSGTEKLNIRANGSASFAAGAFAIESDGDISTNVRCHGNIELDSTGAFTSPKIKLFANTGNATLAGDITLGDFSTAGTTTTGCLFQNEGIMYVQRVANSSEQVFSAWAGTSKNVYINANGSAMFGASGTFGNEVYIQGTDATTQRYLNFQRPTSGQYRATLRRDAWYLGETVTNIGNVTPSGSTIILYMNGNASFSGSVSKGSGSFKIDHPLVGLTTSHHLVHSFIEGPQADLIYRGVVDLVDGTATVNVDTAGRMTEGTFAALCTNVSCFTSNESDWTAVKGSVTGNVLTITAQDNTSTATVSWMVVGERKDQHMIDTEWTDENGRVITEPLKS